MYRTGPIVLGIFVSVALAACGGGGSSARSSTATVKADAPVKAAPQKSAAPKPAPAKAGGAAAACQARLGDLLDRMGDLRQALLAGLSYSEYVLRVEAIQAAYEAVPVDRLGLACLDGPAAEAEDAFNQYLRAANLWGECAGTAGCAAGSIESRLQRRWRIASKSLEAAKRPS